jgi:hypothetical protein
MLLPTEKLFMRQHRWSVARVEWLMYSRFEQRVEFPAGVGLGWLIIIR